MLQLNRLHHFVTLARHLNFARAADNLGLSQSALTRSIQALERQLGTRLFDRDRAGVALTPQGRQALASAAALLADAEDMERRLILNTSAEAGHVRFGMAPMPARVLLPPLISEQLRRVPGVTNEVMVRDADALWAMLIAGEIEFFVINEGFVFDSPPPRIETLGHFPVGLIVRAGHPLLSGNPDGERYPVVRSSWTGLPLPARITPHVQGPANVIEDFGALAAITLASDAVWFSSRYAVEEELRAGTLCELPEDEPGDAIDVKILIYSLERRSQSPWAQALRQVLRQQMRRLNGRD